MARLLLLTALVSASWLQDRRPPEFPSDVRLIRLDVSVVDRHGRPVPGLGRDDFRVSEDGRPVEITFFEAVEAAPVSEGTVAESRSNPVVRRRMVVLVDAATMTVAQLRRARESVARYVREASSDGDWVRIVNLSTGRAIDGHMPADRQFLETAARAMVRGSPLWASAGRLGDPIQDRTETDAVPAEMTLEAGDGPANLSGDPSEAETSGRFLSAFAQTGGLLGTLESLLVQLQGVDGRKALVLISPGFPSIRDFDRMLHRVSSLAREASTAVYFVDAVAMDGLLPTRSGQRMRPVFDMAWARSGGAQDLAEATGGFTSRFDNSLFPALARIGGEMRTYYVIGYAPPRGEDGRFRSVKVRVAAPGLVARTKKGYLAERPRR